MNTLPFPVATTANEIFRLLSLQIPGRPIVPLVLWTDGKISHGIPVVLGPEEPEVLLTFRPDDEDATVSGIFGAIIESLLRNNERTRLATG